MKHPVKFVFFITLTFVLLNCQMREGSTPLAKMVKEEVKGDFGEYWYQGMAEINSYNLEQSRYGEMREGDAVLVFVTEDFSKSKQVKLDYPARSEEDKVSVLKLNSIRKFKTGIYDYSMMQSVFTPVDIKVYPNSLKTTVSSQEWCGHTFTQLNLEDDKYLFSQRSYFESEGDETMKLDNVLLEDELFSRIRINPNSIPTGNVELIPSLFYSRLAHTDSKPKMARIRIVEKEAMNLVVEYLHFERALTIGFERDFPHRILSWTETGGNGKVLSKATLRESIRNAYWTKNSNEYEALRDTLQLKF